MKEEDLNNDMVDSVANKLLYVQRKDIIKAIDMFNSLGSFRTPHGTACDPVLQKKVRDNIMEKMKDETEYLYTKKAFLKSILKLAR